MVEMRGRLLVPLVFLFILPIHIHSAQVLPRQGAKKNRLVAATHEDNSIAKHKLVKKIKNLAHDVTGNTRQQVSYNLDMTNRNGSSTLLFSQDNDVINGGFTEWTAWTECSRECGRRSLRSRERYCTDPSPANGGADCNGERFQLKLCERIPCPGTKESPKERNREDGDYRSIDSNGAGKSITDVSWRWGEWSGWDKCHCKKHYQKRFRECYSHIGLTCPGNTVETKACHPTGCEEKEKSSLVNIDPKDFCGFNPCDFSKCLVAPLGSCVSDYKCRPVFFDEKNKRVEECVGKRIYIHPDKISQVCKINPCDYTRCLLDFSEERCVVGTRCQTVYYNPQGQLQKCTAILKVPAREVCGYDPCSGETCAENPSARCLVTSKCRPIYVNAFNERIRKCEKTGKDTNKLGIGKEDEFEAEPDEDYDNSDDDDNDDDKDDDTDHDNDIDNDAVDDDGDDDDSQTRGTVENNLKINKNSKQMTMNDDDSDDDDIGDDESDYDDDVDDDDNDPRKHFSDSDNGNFKDDLAINTDRGRKAGKIGEHDSLNRLQQSETKEDYLKNNSSASLVRLLNTENGQRRTKKTKRKTFLKNVDASSLSLADIVKGKLKSSQGVVTGTVKKSLKILSSKKPTKFYYFETKAGTGNETRQFMVITAPKNKKSSVLTNNSVHKSKDNE